MRESPRSLLPECDIDSDAIAVLFVAIFEGEFGDSGFVEVAEACGDHAPTQGTVLVTTASCPSEYGPWQKL